ncbi:MAG: type II toxin-antitoxin system VapC family toxin [Bifidobacteriaceae bacterium]|jgi:predicted nucleic acid-binding protein|nr:type II toxin-antitoxin system VapC family toxin [Bifidobacteriaceae bacterium]
MIALDTNVVSELMRPRPDPGVLAWADAQRASELRLTAVTVAEILFGIRRLPPGRRRDDLAAAFDGLRRVEFADRILPFDDHAAEHYATVVALREAEGPPISTADAQIAAICRLHGAALATRNTADFAHCGMAVVNPWARG